MGGAKKKRPAWAPCLEGILLTLAVYLAGHLLLALLVVRGTVNETAAFPVTAALCLLATAGGGLLAGKRTGRPVFAMGVSALFAAVLLCGGLLGEDAAWTGRDGVLLLCALCGGAAAAPMSKKRRRGIRRR